MWPFGLSLYDDFVHVGLACEASQKLSGYRPFVYRLICFLGENVAAVKLASLASLIAAAFLYRRVLVRVSQRAGETRPLLLAAVHPLVLFPVFYASQFSSAITLLWAVLACTALFEGAARRWIDLAVLGILLLVGIQLRIEALLILAALFATLYFVRTSIFGHPAHWRSCARFSAFSASFWVAFRFNMKTDIGSLVAVSTVFDATQVADYPRESYAALQAYATILYSKAFFWPFSLKFFGPWYDWYAIHRSPILQASLLAGLAVATTFLLALSLGFWKRLNAYQRLAAFALVVFLGLSFGQSLAMRQDWYFVSRAIVPAFIALSLLSISVHALSRKAEIALFAFFAATSLWHLFFHFSSADRMARVESGVADRNPAYRLMRVTDLLRQNLPEDALLESHAAYKLVKPEYFEASQQSIAYSAMALVHGYRISKRIGYEESAASAVHRLKKYENLYSMAICIDSRLFPVQECVPEGSKARFCRQISDPVMYDHFLKPEFIRNEAQISGFCKTP